MSRPTTAQLAAILRAWRSGSELLDTLGPRTDALLLALELTGAKPTPAPRQHVDTATMSDAELRAHYAKTAHVEDIRFHLRCAAGRVDAGDWRALLELVEANDEKATVQSKRQYWALVQAHRERRLALERVPIVCPECGDTRRRDRDCPTCLAQSTFTDLDTSQMAAAS